MLSGLNTMPEYFVCQFGCFGRSDFIGSLSDDLVARDTRQSFNGGVDFNNPEMVILADIEHKETIYHIVEDIPVTPLAFSKRIFRLLAFGDVMQGV